jgi:pilus assembly protein CpaB
MGRRTLLLIAALVVAALGTVLIFAYVRSADQRADDNAAQVEVLVATEEVATGTTAAEASNAGAFELKQIDAGDAPEGALTDISIISDQVALAPVFPGQVVLAQMFGSAIGSSELAPSKGQLAMSVELGDPERVAGFVTPGSFVTVMYTEKCGGGGATMTIVPRSQVLATGATTLSTKTVTDDEGQSTTEAISQTILTLETDQIEAQRIVNGLNNGCLQFGLLGSDTTTRTGILTTPRDLRR